MTQLIAVILGIGPLYALVLHSGFVGMHQPTFEVPDLRESLAHLLIFVFGFGGLLVMLLYLVCGQRLSDLNLRPGRWLIDLRSGVMLAGALLAYQFAFSMLTAQLGYNEVPEANLAIARELSDDPWLLALWLGPTVWLQAGLFEELSRSFMLSRLWQVWSGPAGKWLVLIGSSLLFGLGHLYQGPLGVFGTALIGFILGWHYLVRGRLLPLIIAHGLYDTAVILALVSAVRYGMI
jgi:membrane protease YdiL (CAAX protease family)